MKKFEGDAKMMLDGKPWPPLRRELDGDFVRSHDRLPSIPPRERREIHIPKTRVAMRRAMLKIDDVLVDEIRSDPFDAAERFRRVGAETKTYEVKVFSKVRDFDSPNGLDRPLTFVHRSVFLLQDWKDVPKKELEDVLIAEAIAEALRFAWHHEISECVFIGEKYAVHPHPDGGFSSNVGLFDSVGASQAKGVNYRSDISHRKR